MKFGTGNIITTIFLLLQTCFADDRYAVKTIPLSLISSGAVVREADCRFVIKDDKRAIETVKRAITIFSAEEREEGTLVLWYDKYRSIEELDGIVYDSEGNEIADLDDENIKDYSNIDDATLHSDSRVRIASLYHSVYPYTIEYTYEIEYHGSLNWPIWIAQEDEHSVQHTSFAVTYPDDYPLRYWSNRDSIPLSKETKGGLTTIRWEAENLKSLSKDLRESDLYDITSVVHIAPTMFAIDDMKGSMSSWKDFGLWYKELLADRCLLPEKAVNEIKLMMDSCHSDYEKIATLYRYMQSRTRYMSIQLGIGGWQPFEAAFVHDRRYGDCKALVNYMYTLLKYAGVNSYPALIKSGSQRYPLIEEFPSNQFNHVILCVPTDKDTVWLECTDQSSPVGRLGPFTENRAALLISSAGGVIVRTPPTTSKDNLQNRIAYINLSASGNAAGIIKTKVTGNQQIDYQNVLFDASVNDRKTWVQEQFSLPNISLSDLAMTGVEEKSPEIALTVEATFPKYGSVSGNRVFLNPSILTQRTYVPPQRDARISPVRFVYPYRDEDSIFFRLPTNFTVETIPQEANIETSFGSFHSKTSVLNNGMLVYVRCTEITVTLVPASQYEEYRKFCSGIVKADRGQVVLVGQK